MKKIIMLVLFVSYSLTASNNPIIQAFTHLKESLTSLGNNLVNAINPSNGKKSSSQANNSIILEGSVIDLTNLSAGKFYLINAQPNDTFSVKLPDDTPGEQNDIIPTTFYYNVAINSLNQENSVTKYLVDQTRKATLTIPADSKNLTYSMFLEERTLPSWGNTLVNTIKVADIIVKN